MREICDLSECGGCSCHISPPCSHCCEHVIDSPLARLFKDTDGNWVGYCRIPGCLGYGERHAEGESVVTRTFFQMAIRELDDHVRSHYAYMRLL
jgi:hypothetical protein